MKSLVLEMGRLARRFFLSCEHFLEIIDAGEDDHEYTTNEPEEKDDSKHPEKDCRQNVNQMCQA